MQQIKPIMDLELYLLDIIKWEYIDKSNSFIDNNGEIFLKIKTELLPTPDIHVKRRAGANIIYRSIKDFLENLLCPTNFTHSIYYIICDYTGKPIDIRATSRVAGMIDVYKKPNILTEVLTTMENLKHSDFFKYREQMNNFKNSVEQWIKSQIKNALFVTNVKGSFSADSIKDDTYFQRRSVDDIDIYYIIHQWWINLIDNQVTWVDIDGGKGKVFVSAR